MTSSPATSKRSINRPKQTRARLVKETVALQPVLSKNALQTGKDRRVVDETMVPKRYGGHQGSIRTRCSPASPDAWSIR